LKELRALYIKYRSQQIADARLWKLIELSNPKPKCPQADQPS
jgi:hypothetical protein